MSCLWKPVSTVVRRSIIGASCGNCLDTGGGGGRPPGVGVRDDGGGGGSTGVGSCSNACVWGGYVGVGQGWGEARMAGGAVVPQVWG